MLRPIRPDRPNAAAIRNMGIRISGELEMMPGKEVAIKLMVFMVMFSEGLFGFVLLSLQFGQRFSV